MTTEDTLINLAKLREPFPENQISQLPKPTKVQTDAVKNNYKEGIRCQVCGGWHHPKVIHLDYVGHAALTDRLLDVDPMWKWKPMALTEQGTPLFDQQGGLWIKLTICGVKRPGYGHADKKGGDAVKEIIGDAIRNAAMRFGCALDLWHKGDLHADDEKEPPKEEVPEKPPWHGPLKITELKNICRGICDLMNKVTVQDDDQYINGILLDNKTQINQAIIDLPDFVDSVKDATKKARDRVNAG